VDVILRDNTLAHDVLAVVGTQVHPFSMPSSVVDVVASKKEASSVSAVRAKANFTSMMDVALVDPNFTAMP
jgi:hypothetical protein